MLKFYACFSFSILSFNINLFAQYCTAVGPSSNADSNLQSFTLNGESATSITFTGCPGVIGLDDQTFSESVVLNASGSYTASALFGTCLGNYSGVGEAWIDYNQNSIFEISESIGTWSGTPPSAVSNWNFTVPAGAISGATRLRVVHYEGGFLPLDPCAVFTWGSITDFTVQIGGGLDCSAYVGESFTDPRLITTLPFSESYSNTPCYFNVLTVYNSPDVFYRILPITLGANFLTVSLCGSTIDTYLSILDADGNVLFYNDDFSSCNTSSQITFASSTLDTVYLAVQGWGNATGNYEIEVTQEFSTITENNSFDISIFPNPTTNEFKIISELSGNVTICDLTGKIVYNSVFQPNSIIDVANFLAGTYLVKFENETGQSLQKLVIQ